MTLSVLPRHQQIFRSIAYSQELIRRRSITPDDQGCQLWLADKLSRLGFSCQHFEVEGVSNLLAILGQGQKTLAFAGHTDVVPPGPLDKWLCDPFAGQIIDNELIGRGAADMKTGVAAMLAATERFLAAKQPFNQRLVWLITSDEEGEAEFGSKVLKAELDRQNIHLDYCLVGEPTASRQTGDTVKVGRRGAISARLKVLGKQGHVAYPQYADNAIHKMGKVIAALNNINWDCGSDDFPGTSLQITHIDSGAFTDNIVPAQCSICFNIRYSHRYDLASLQQLIQETLLPVTNGFELQWERPCEPYFTSQDSHNSLIHEVEQAIFHNTGKFPVLSTSGGTSDGRFFAGARTQVVELGVPNRTIHQVNERVHIADLIALEDIYTEVLQRLLA
ncbi:succinyl-diaminopimelate desuccinylase [Bowmanella denitrificans]|uniref:Succinyl-diaminopimelate desuccinylase n=1 Tax=Bowmanella denitrificans TaxID=366582 RepID=A0ABN0X216_9ALTE